jgi:hypothetical protein
LEPLEVPHLYLVWWVWVAVGQAKVALWQLQLAVALVEPLVKTQPEGTGLVALVGRLLALLPLGLRVVPELLLQIQ